MVELYGKLTYIVSVRALIKRQTGAGEKIVSENLAITHIRLRKNEERRILAGHPWIFSNEIETDFKPIPPGSLVEVYSHQNRFLGTGYINPQSLIAVRLLTRMREEINKDFFRIRIEKAIETRKWLYPDRSSYRICHSESDFLPGLIVDKYESTLVLQFLTAGMERFKSDITEILWKHFNPEAMVYRNDASYRVLEGLFPEKAVIRGELPKDLHLNINGLIYEINVLEGQKTGFFLDQVENREALKTYVKDKTVLDAFCYNGAWGINALSFGAKHVTFVDSSGPALQLAQKNAALNGFHSKYDSCRKDVFDFLKTCRPYDVIIIDPPAFVKSRAKLKEAISGYIDLNRKAMEKVNLGGCLVSCSCSHHISTGLFEDIILKAGQLAKKIPRLLERRSQAKDHPVLLSVPETEYLKCFFLEML